MRELQPTRHAALGLAEECRLMRQGYDFLDQKRMLLAAEMLRQLDIYQRLSKSFETELKVAAKALAAAVDRHGLDNLQIYPPAPAMDCVSERRAFLGVSLVSVRPSAEPAGIAQPPLDPSPEAEACRAAFQRLFRASADKGALACNLERLAREYRRTDRRAKALENVLLPEVKEAIKRVEEQFDTWDREEAIRARWSKRMPGFRV